MRRKGAEAYCEHRHRMRRSDTETHKGDRRRMRRTNAGPAAVRPPAQRGTEAYRYYRCRMRPQDRSEDRLVLLPCPWEAKLRRIRTFLPANKSLAGMKSRTCFAETYCHCYPGKRCVLVDKASHHAACSLLWGRWACRSASPWGVSCHAFA
jgi:hypothetical protein